MNQVYSALTNYNRDQTDNNPKHKSTLEENHSISPFEERLRTFDNWPNTQVSKRDLASAGFVYTGQDDIVVCRLCKIEGYNWVSGDDPMADHREWSPSCPFLTTVDSSQPRGNRNTDTCGLYGIALLPNSLPEDNIAIDLQRLCIPRGQGPRHQDKTSLDSRLATFEHWPRSMKQRPAELAEAGFYYTGVGDRVVCFYCGGALKDWEESDDPWGQHALWFDACYYLNSKKGTDFVENIQRNRDPRLSLPGTSDDETKEAVVPKESSSETPEKFEKNTETEPSESPWCKICFQNKLDVLFLPCRHAYACVDCASALKTCAVCRGPLESSVRMFIS